MTVKVTSDEFSGITNPYTGESIEVEMTVNPGMEPMFRSPSTYSTDDVFPTKELCLAMWDRKNGVSGLRRGGPVACAYTGELLSLVQVAGGWKLRGGFNPHMFWTRNEFLRFANMRGGVSDRPSPGPAVRVTSVPAAPRVTELMKRTAESRTPGLDEEKLHEVEHRLNGIGVRVGGSVHVSRRKRRRGK